MVEFSLKQVSPKIWHLNFSDSWDLTMHFFRFQEWYESPDMKQKNVQFVDLMENYSRKVGKGKFSYPSDWAGFNLPGEEVFKRQAEGITDPNRYDELMISLTTYMRAKENSSLFYIIGTSDDDPYKNMTFNHELAHGMFFADDSYRARMTKYVEAMPAKTRDKMFSVLGKWGYAEKFYIDEAQAYLSTGLQEGLEVKCIKDCQAKFKRLFNAYTKEIRKKPEKR